MAGKLHGAIEFLEKLDRLGAEELSGDDFYYVLHHLDAVRRAAESLEFMARARAHEMYKLRSQVSSDFAAQHPDGTAWVDSCWVDFVHPPENHDLFQAGVELPDIKAACDEAASKGESDPWENRGGA